MPIEVCQPPYTYRPSSTPTEPAVAPSFREQRARLFAGGTFFRTKFGGPTANNIAVEYLDVSGTIRVNVYENGGIVETFNTGLVPETPTVNPTPPPPFTCTRTVNPQIRNIINSGSSYIEMPPLDYGGVEEGITPIWQSGNQPDDTPPGDDCASFFPVTNLTGGGTAIPPISSIWTGPERTLIIAEMSEIVNGDETDDGIMILPPIRVRQWDGSNFIAYIPNSDCVILP